VRRWINRHGGLSRHMIYLQGRDLSGIIPSCEQATRQANIGSNRRHAARPLRYQSAEAASYGQ
jgi:hypothetical protein